nr:CRISPR-associated helicase Cas3' [Candidatus Cloacimonadota bacterium]
AGISALWAYIYTKEILGKDNKTALLTYLIIKRHHGSIKDYEDNFIDGDHLSEINEGIDYQALRSIYQDVLKTECFTAEFFEQNFSSSSMRRIVRKEKKQTSIDDYFAINYLFSLLTYADKYNAIFGKTFEKKEKIPLQSEYVKLFKDSLPKKENVINSIREEAFDQAENNISNKHSIFSLNLPTGCGKTLNAINLALKLTEFDKSLERIIYCLPFTSIIDQNEKVFQELLKYNQITPNSDIILKHHHLSNFDYISENEDYTAQESEFFTETWESQLVVTTFYQLLHTLLTNQNSALKKFHNLANSVIILDEIQAIPHKYWLLVKEMLTGATDYLKCKIILVTATMPLIFDEEKNEIFDEEKNEIFELAKSKESFFQQLDRIDLNLSWLSKMSIDDLLSKLIVQINAHSDKSHLIICNTINSAADVHNRLLEEFPEKEVLYLSTRLLPLHRLEIIKQIRNNPQGKIIVSTQLVEAGVDIDIDFVYRDFAPLDSIFQSCGRCNRNNQKGKAQVFLFELISQNDRSMHSYIYDEVLTDTTRECLQGSESIAERDFFQLALDYYTKHKERTCADDKILSLIKELQYKEAFDFTKPGSFKLIDSFETVTCFIEYDEKAKELYQKSLELKAAVNDNPYENRILLKQVFREMSPYIISLPEKLCEGEKEFFYISSERKDTYYSKEMGFKTIQDKEDYFI